MKKIIQLEILETLLRLWEDANIFGEFSFQNYLRVGKVLGKEISIQPGSEMSENGMYLYRSISDWKYLRILLEENDEPINYYAFLPRVPKSLREDIGDNRELFSELVEMGGVLLFPIFVSKWILGKKVFSVSDEARIPFVPLSEENHMSHLPYDDFIINMERPFVANFAGNETVFNVKTLMVSKREDYVHILIVPEEMRNFLYTDEERKVLERLTFLSMTKNINSLLKEKKKFVRMFMGEGAEDLENLGNFIPGSVMYSRNFRIHIPTGVYTYRNQERPEKNLTFSEDVEMGKTDPGFAVTSYVNGLCKIISEMENVHSIHIRTADDVDFVHPKTKKFKGHYDDFFMEEESEEILWNEVTEGQVLHLSAEIKVSGTSFSIKCGSEKSPHLRRGHFRNITRGDNTVNTVWIRSCMIREDKIKKDCVKSGISNIKE